MKWLNANAVHNVINVLILILTSEAFLSFDWTMFGIDQSMALKLTGALMLLKIVINVRRDGVTGLVKPQPPVEE